MQSLPKVLSSRLPETSRPFRLNLERLRARRGVWRAKLTPEQETVQSSISTGSCSTVIMNLHEDDKDICPISKTRQRRL
ncbi:hypothetical protein AMTR_s00015p00088370 [Amborella trichopoda]|uniref:Uncharacterized protein n=1 Tax=Amborella trichopoda TaxID=13333 RepID=W1PLD1_AMBTC|nr:hypothetical protein AMTR_s00015p00088370 [Amborella trichopoda]